MSEQTNQFKEIFSEGKDFLKLRLEYGKLTLAEKLTLLLSSLALGLICVFLAVIAVFFLSISGVDWIAAYVGHSWAALIMCGFYLLLIITIYLARKPLLINPMARLISRIILK
ncbi:MAG: phage holin family protein [Firmicutes bacterium]|nr:phage holin family protein [Bacillota bacterium]MCM1401152.1 phage holin family protein [Bacteroides sp.]MCM1477025.1 phage holin family protein [Bacteroides sp.]